MHQKEGSKMAGVFTLPCGAEIQGELLLNGGKTELKLSSNKPHDVQSNIVIHGTLLDQTKVYLLDCISRKTSWKRTGSASHYTTHVFPHYAIFGSTYIDSSSNLIKQLSFTIDDADVLFDDCKTFGEASSNVNEYMERIAGDQVRLAKKRTGSVPDTRKLKIGAEPQLYYFTGNHEILSVDTSIGKVSVKNIVDHENPSSKGIHITNTIKVYIEFESKEIFKDAIKSLIDLLTFLQIILGRPQSISKLSLIFDSSKKPTRVSDIYWSLPPSKNSINFNLRKPDIHDLPLKAGIEPDNFKEVLKNWLARKDDWRSARGRFSNSFLNQRAYNIDRIVGAANMFDILPSDIFEKNIDLSEDLLQAKENARIAFKKLPNSPERASVLGALSRLGSMTLKNKIRSREKLITDIIASKLPDIDMVINQAVDCRNYYVHGSEKVKFDYDANPTQTHFFTDTLEFIFVVSDLIQAGWNINEWNAETTHSSHPFANYLNNYPDQLSALQQLMNQKCRKP